MKTSSHTSIDSKDGFVTTTSHTLTTAEKVALLTIASCACHWEKKRAYVEFRNVDDKLDESKTLTQPPCHALHQAGLLESDPMAMHGYQFSLTNLGRRVAAALTPKASPKPVKAKRRFPVEFENTELGDEG